MENWKAHLEELRPLIISQQTRMRDTLAHALSALRKGESTLLDVQTLAAGEFHPFLLEEIGPDFLVESLLAAWSMAAGNKTVESVVSDLALNLGSGNFLPLGSKRDQDNALLLAPYISTVCANIQIWDGCTFEEYAELARTWIRIEDLQEAFADFSSKYNLSLETVIQAGLVLLSYLEDLLLLEF